MSKASLSSGEIHPCDEEPDGSVKLDKGGNEGSSKYLSCLMPKMLMGSLLLLPVSFEVVRQVTTQLLLVYGGKVIAEILIFWPFCLCVQQDGFCTQ